MEIHPLLHRDDHKGRGCPTTYPRTREGRLRGTLHPHGVWVGREGSPDIPQLPIEGFNALFSFAWHIYCL
jgi:hypothetical protein